MFAWLECFHFTQLKTRFLLREISYPTFLGFLLRRAQNEIEKHKSTKRSKKCARVQLLTKGETEDHHAK